MGMLSQSRGNASLPHLGLVCITASEQVRYRTVTRKRLLQLSAPEQQQTLRRLYRENLDRFTGALEFCAHEGIRLYRLTSGLLPFADDLVGETLLPEVAPMLQRAGKHATALGIRVVVHPDQFVVLSSDSPAVVRMSVQVLTMQARILDLLGQPRSPWAAIELHGGKAQRGAQLVNVIQGLPEAIRSRLALENDEYAYGAREILEICRATGVPMVFDAHHHICYEGLTTYDDPSVAEMLAAARETWPVPQWQLVHISNGRTSFGDRHHSDLITRMPSAYREAPWIEVEAKGKEKAIRRLRAEWWPTVADGWRQPEVWAAGAMLFLPQDRENHPLQGEAGPT